jgi:hypothetical protein
MPGFYTNVQGTVKRADEDSGTERVNYIICLKGPRKNLPHCKQYFDVSLIEDVIFAKGQQIVCDLDIDCDGRLSLSNVRATQ